MDDQFARDLQAGFRVFPPLAEFVLGAVVLVVGGSLCLALWNAGYISAHALFLPLLGLFGIANGFVRRHRAIRLSKEIRIVREREVNLVDAICVAISARQCHMRILQEAGISDDRIRAYLLLLANNSLRRAAPKS